MNDNSERLTRFVSLNAENKQVVVQSGSELPSDDQVIFANQGVIFFTQWYTEYIRCRQPDYDSMMNTEESIRRGNDDMLKLKLEFMKDVFKHTEMVKLLPSLMSDQAKYYEDYFSEDSIVRKETDKGLNENHKKFAQKLIKRSNSHRYPLIWYYSTDHGMKMWFSPRSLISFYPIDLQLKFQYYEGSLPEIYDMARTVQSNTDADFYAPVRDENSARRRIVAIYKKCRTIAHRLLNLECRYMLIFKPESVYKGVVYRGETMSEKQLTKLQERVENLSTNSPYHMFSLNITSTTIKEAVAKRFFKSESKDIKDGRNVLHKIHLITPKQEDIDEFNRLFPKFILHYCCASIEKLSDIPDEKEILCPPNMDIQFVSIEPRSGLWVVEGITPVLHTIEFGDTEGSANDWMEFQEDILQRNRLRAAELNQRYPNFLAKFYMEFLDKLAIVQTAIELHPNLFQSENMTSFISDMYGHLNYMKTFVQ